MLEIKDKIYKALFDPSIYDQLQTLYKDMTANPQQYDYMMGGPENMQLNFKDAYLALSQVIAKGMVVIKEQFGNVQRMQQDQHLIYDIGTFYLNWQAFLSTIQMLGTPEQVEKWSALIYDHRILGGYSQTEIGHGSNVQKLETIAKYDKETDSFILESPTASAYKFWPGMIGIFATHTVAQAQTYVNGKHIGLQTFVIQIRDTITFDTLPNVECGDIGPKFGFLRADNGYLGFQKLKVPRKSMLMKYVQIDNQGVVTQLSKNAIKFGYGSMLNLRVQLVFNFSVSGLCINNLAFDQVKARLETESRDPGCISISFKLLRSYVMNYAMLLSNVQLKRIFDLYQSQLLSNDPQTSHTLNLVHLYSSQMKSLSGWESIKTSREALSIAPFGHLNASNIMPSYADNTPFATYEGDNNVLLQQTTQYLLKQFQHLAQNEKAKGIAEYFNKFVSNKYQCLQLTQLDDIMEMRIILERLSFLFAKHTIQGFQESLGEGLQKAYNELHQSDLIKMSAIFGYVNVFNFLVMELNNFLPQIKKEGLLILETLTRLYGAFLILEYRTLIIAFDIAQITQINILKSIDRLSGDKYELLSEFSSGINMIRLRKFLNINWHQLKLHPNL